MANEKGTRIGIIGAGGMGTAMARILCLKNYQVEIWCFEEDVAREINKRRRNSRYLKGVELPQNLTASMDIEKVAGGKNFLLLAVPSPFIVNILKKFLHVENIREGKTQIGVFTKGFITTARGTRLIIESMEDYLPGIYKGNLVYISGPSHAEEIGGNKITGLISASLNGKNAIQFRELLSGSNLFVFSSLDVVGVQVCAALKNVIALAFGMMDALKEQSGLFGDNSESLLLAAGLNEIQKLGLAMGSSHPETFTSIAGVGDLDVTCRSNYGRNRRFGREIITKNILKPFKNIEELLENIGTIGYLPEGVFAARRAFELCNEKKLKLPISTGVYRVLNREVSPMRQVEQILQGFTKSGGEPLL